MGTIRNGGGKDRLQQLDQPPVPTRRGRQHRDNRGGSFPRQTDISHTATQLGRFRFQVGEVSGETRLASHHG